MGNLLSMPCAKFPRSWFWTACCFDYGPTTSVQAQWHGSWWNGSHDPGMIIKQINSYQQWSLYKSKNLTEKITYRLSILCQRITINRRLNTPKQHHTTQYIMPTHLILNFMRSCKRQWSSSASCAAFYLKDGQLIFSSLATGWSKSAYIPDKTSPHLSPDQIM